MKLNKLLPETVLAKLPPLGTEGKDPQLVVKFFYPAFHWTWYGIEYDPKTMEFFGLVVGDETEFGYFSLKELMETKDKMGCEIERDLHFKPCPASKVYDLDRRGQLQGGLINLGYQEENMQNIAEVLRMKKKIL